MVEEGDASASTLPTELHEGVEVAANRVAMFLHASKCQKAYPDDCCRKYGWCKAVRHLMKHSGCQHDICRVTWHWWNQWTKDKATVKTGGAETELFRRVTDIITGPGAVSFMKTSSTKRRNDRRSLEEGDGYVDDTATDWSFAPAKDVSAADAVATSSGTENARASWTNDETVRAQFQQDFDHGRNKITLEEAFRLPATSSQVIRFKCTRQGHRQPRYSNPLCDWVASEGPYKCPRCKIRPPDWKKAKFKDLPASILTQFEQAYDEEGTTAQNPKMTKEWARNRSVGSRSVALWKCPNHPHERFEKPLKAWLKVKGLCKKCRKKSSEASQSGGPARKKSRRSSSVCGDDLIVVDGSDTDSESDDCRKRKSKTGTQEPTPKMLRAYGLFCEGTQLQWVKERGQEPVNARVIGDNIADAASKQTFEKVSAWCKKVAPSSKKRAWEAVLVFKRDPNSNSAGVSRTMRAVALQLRTRQKQCSGMKQLIERNFVKPGKEAILLKWLTHEQTVDLLPNGMFQLDDKMCVDSAYLFRFHAAVHALKSRCPIASWQDMSRLRFIHTAVRGATTFLFFFLL
eukprot:INCI597.3.p1 GENE.INCI597.3~~INCI597.3.p1  ORF type:complete len:599 (-),score=90.13 INCI597.3:499-2214(-)